MNRISKLVFPAVLSLLASAPVFAGGAEVAENKTKTPSQEPQAGELKSAKKQINASGEFAQALLAINTMSGEFTQRVMDTEGEELQVTEGEFKIKRPGYFFWKVLPPYEQIVIGTPESLKVYDPDLEQLSVHNQSSLAGTPASLISGDVDAIARDYDVDKQSSKEGETFVLKQKDSELSAFETLAFSFAKKGKGLALNKMVFTDKLGQRTEVVMSKTKANQEISAQAFVFDVPPGTDVIVDG